MGKIQWDYSKIGDRIVWNRLRSLRKERGLTQLEVAKGTGLSIVWIGFAEKGYDNNISDKAKQKIADFFECDISDIFPTEFIGDKPIAEAQISEGKK